MRYLAVAIFVSLLPANVLAGGSGGAGQAGGSFVGDQPAVNDFLNGNVPPSELSWKDRFKRANELALQNEVFQEELLSLALKGYVDGLGNVSPSAGVKADLLNSLINEIKTGIEVSNLFDKDITFTQAFRSVMGVVEFALTKKFPGLSYPLSAAKVATAYTTAFTYHAFFEDI